MNTILQEYATMPAETLVIWQEVSDELKQMIIDIDRVQVEFDKILTSHVNK